MSKKQYLASGVLHCGKLYRNAIVAIDGDKVTLRPFVGEEAGTVFVSGIIVVCRHAMLTERHIATLTAMVKNASTFDAAADAVVDYVATNNLCLTSAHDSAYEHTEAPELLILSRK